MKICLSCGVIHERPGMKPCCAIVELKPIRTLWEERFLLERKVANLEAFYKMAKPIVDRIEPGKVNLNQAVLEARCPSCSAVFRIDQ